LPPYFALLSIEQGGQFDPLDSAHNPEAQKEPVEMSFDGAPRHAELLGDLRVIAALEQ
jgi:hypothetical protein